MYTIDKKTIVEDTIKGSKFITILYPIASKDEALNCLKETKENFKKATHYCYAYRLENFDAMSDDKEPARTAGTPMLEVLKKKDMINVLAVVVRYFGGVKLGPGGLIRAYSGGVKKALEQANIKSVIEGYIVELIFPYSKEKELAKLLSNYSIINKEYNTECTYTISIPKDALNMLQNIIPTKIIVQKLIPYK